MGRGKLEEGKGGIVSKQRVASFFLFPEASTSIYLRDITGVPRSSDSSSCVWGTLK